MSVLSWLSSSSSCWWRDITRPPQSEGSASTMNAACCECKDLWPWAGYNRAMSMLERAEAAERALIEEMDRTIVKSIIYVSGDRDPRVSLSRPDNGKLVMMGPDPRLAPMPERPTLFDFF